MPTKTSSGVCAVLPAKAASSAPCRAPRSCSKVVPRVQRRRMRKAGTFISPSWERHRRCPSAICLLAFCMQQINMKYEAPAAASGEKRKRAPPMCNDCGHPLSQLGYRESTLRFCTAAPTRVRFKGPVSCMLVGAFSLRDWGFGRTVLLRVGHLHHARLQVDVPVPENALLLQANTTWVSRDGRCTWCK